MANWAEEFGTEPQLDTKSTARPRRNQKNERSPSYISPVAGERREGAQRFVG